MKTIIEFDGGVEDDHDKMCAINAAELYAAVFRIDERCRGVLKHADDETRQVMESFVAEIREMCRDVLHRVGE